MEYGSYEHRDAQSKMIKEITELFLTVPLQKPLPRNGSGEIVRDVDADRLEALALKDQFFKLDELIKASGGLQSLFVLRLVTMLQEKAQLEIARCYALALTVDPDVLAKDGVPEHLIDGVKELHKYFRKELSTDGGEKGGKNQTDKQKENEYTHIDYYLIGLEKPNTYKNKSDYLDAMRDKTGSTPKTVNNHLKKHNLFEKKLGTKGGYYRS